MGQRKENKVFPLTPAFLAWCIVALSALLRPEAGMLGIGEGLTPPLGVGLASDSLLGCRELCEG